MNDVMVYAADPLYLKPYSKQAEQLESRANTQPIDHMGYNNIHVYKHYMPLANIHTRCIECKLSQTGSGKEEAHEHVQAQFVYDS